MVNHNDGIENWIPCPECLEQAPEHEVRQHLQDVHEWTEEEVKDHFDQEPVTEVPGPSAPVSERDTTPSYGAEGQDDEFQEAEEESDLCDCDTKHKETQVIQKSTGANIAGLGGKRGTGTPVIICKKCGEQFEVKDGSEGFGPGIIWDGDGPGPF